MIFEMQLSLSNGPMLAGAGCHANAIKLWKSEFIIGIVVKNASEFQSACACGRSNHGKRYIYIFCIDFGGKTNA